MSTKAIYVVKKNGRYLSATGEWTPDLFHALCFYSLVTVKDLLEDNEIIYLVHITETEVL